MKLAMAEQRLLISADPTCDSSGLARSLFQRRAFFELHADDSGVFFEWAHGQRVVASIHFTPLPDGLWRSPARGTFAGYVFEPSVSQQDLGAFHDAVLQSLVDRGARHIEVLPAPMAHDPVAFTNQVYLLRSRGYAISQCDLNHSLGVTDQSLAERMTYGNQKRLRKCEREGLRAEQLSLQDLGAVYEVIEANRLTKGHAMSMSLPQLQTMAAKFPMPSCCSAAETAHAWPPLRCACVWAMASCMSFIGATSPVTPRSVPWSALPMRCTVIASRRGCGCLTSGHRPSIANLTMG